MARTTNLGEPTRNDLTDTKFSLSSDDCELLLIFERAKSLQRAARLVSLDVSAVSRRLQHLSSKAPVVEKVGNRWRLTEAGFRINRWTEDALSQQAKLLSQKTELKLGASRLFAAKVLVRHLPEFRKALEGSPLAILSLDGPLEPYLLNGTIDVAFTCGRPKDPFISHRRLVRERYVATASKEFLLKHRFRGEEIYDLPFLAFRDTSGFYPFAYVVSKTTNVVATFNDSVSLTEAVCAGLGWSILPHFAVKAVPDVLTTIPDIDVEAETYGVWWLRSRKSAQPIVNFATKWLRGLNLLL